MKRENLSVVMTTTVHGTGVSQLCTKVNNPKGLLFRMVLNQWGNFRVRVGSRGKKENRTGTGTTD